MFRDSKFISRSLDVMGGATVFSNTRVPVQTFLDYLKAGESIDDFLDGFPTVTREQERLQFCYLCRPTARNSTLRAYRR